jgi:uncharacterized protein (TIGR02147 family)
MAEIYQYKDYREFLRQYVFRRKSESPHWTIAAWAKQLGLQATTSMTKILNGQREPGEKICQKLINYFSFSPQEALYFQYLVHLSKCTDLHMREVFLEKLIRLTPVKGKLHLEEARFQIVAEWTHYTIRQMAQVMPLPNDPEWIANQMIFTTTASQVQKAIDNLLQLDLIKLIDGKLRRAEGWISTTEDVPSQALRSHASQMMENAKQALEQVPVQQREICSMTMAVPMNKMEKAKDMIRQFVSDFGKMMDVESTDQVYQLNVQFFPLTRLEVNEEKSQEIQP